MSFKKIEVYGFKSFADKLGIEFGNGITAIVGPNGCGKSNFADAIRWVLGEQSPKNLRGSNMQDVIFKGAENRKCLSFCEVSLVFDNLNRAFNVDYDEVVLSRKLFRNGTSEYSLNRTPCLLRDISSLLHDIGVGRDGYSIIGQGKVEQIVSSKPEDRRIIFEEAAGIAKFKERKTEAERKLAHTQENIVLLENTATEIDRMLAPMKKQAETAKKYLEFREQLKYNEVNNYIFHYENASAKKAEIGINIEGYKQAVALKEKQVNETIAKQNQSLEGIKAIDEQIQALRDEILKITVGIEKHAGDQRVVQAKIEYMREQVTSLEQHISESKAEFIKINDELQANTKSKQIANEQLNKLNAQVDELQQIYAGVLEQLRASEDVLSGSQQEMQDALNKITDIKSNIARLETEKGGLAERIRELKIRQNELIEKQQGAEIIEKQALLAKQEAENEGKNCVDNLSALRENLASVENGKNEVQNSLNQSNAVLNQLLTREKLLNEMQQEYEGYNGTVRRLLLDAGKNASLSSLIVGVVGELIKTPQALETAIEMALGYSVHSIVTQNEQNAKKLVAYLKENKYGRATFLPISSMKKKYISDAYKLLLNIQDCYGIASDLITYDDAITPVIEGLLGSTVIVKDMEVAVELAQKSQFGFKIVTLEGDIINPAGSITGGSKKTEINNLLSRERELETIANRINAQSSNVAELQNTFNLHNEMISKLSKEIELQVQKLRDCEVELAQKDEIFKYAQESSELYATELDKIVQEITRFDTRFDIICKELNIAKGMDSVTLESNAEGKSNNAYDILRSKRDTLAEEITNAKIKIATITANVSAHTAEIERLILQQEEISQEIDESNSLLAKNARTIDTAKQLGEGTDGADIIVESDKLKKVKEKVIELERIKDELHSSMAGIEEERTRLTGEYARAQEKIYQEEAKLNQIDTNIENMQDRILEDYELTYLTARDMKDPDFDAEAGQIKINELKREISKLGNVNVNAIEDSKELDTRFTELTTQLEDLRKAEDDVLTIIKELATQMTEKFDTEFQKINENFSRIFRELFGGGKARLVLTTEDVLTAGIDIIAEPPGKTLGNLSLLSGGEKSLTAIAILFAILKLRPMPFCLLDEIDAALDDSNVERFAKYLHRFAGETQFIVITHRKPTMELADSLYGVTMENKGVSKVVSVKLSDAIKTIQTD